MIGMTPLLNEPGDGGEIIGRLNIGRIAQAKELAHQGSCSVLSRPPVASRVRHLRPCRTYKQTHVAGSQLEGRLSALLPASQKGHRPASTWEDHPL